MSVAPVPTAWDSCSRLLGQILLLPMSCFAACNYEFLTKPFYFLSFLWACRVRKTRVEALITPAMMKLCPLHLQDPCQ